MAIFFLDCFSLASLGIAMTLIASYTRFVIARRIHHHFFPHFLVDIETVGGLAEPNRVHHRAHALNLSFLFIYLQILLLFGTGLFVVRLKAPQILGTVTFSTDQIIALTNQKREQNGLSDLSYNSQLAAAAVAKAQNMFSENYWAHNSPSGRTPWSFITAAGYRYVFAGENLARDFEDSGAVVNAWMNSPSHRDNLLDKNFKEIGVAVESGKLTGHDGILVVQEFGASVSPSSALQSRASEGKQTPATPSASPALSPLPEIASSAPGETRIDNGTDAVTVLASRQFSIAKIVTFSVIGFIFLLFAVEILVTLKREKVYLRSGVIAHLLLLAFVLLAVWYAVSGAII